MPRHSSPLPRRLAPLRRAAATAGLTVAALVVGAGGYTVATSPALAGAPGDRFAVADLFGSADDAGELDTAAVRRDEEQASRSQRTPLAAGLPSTSSQAQSWVDEVAGLEASIATRTAQEQAALAAAEKAAAEKAAAEKLAAEQAAAAEKAAAELAAAQQAAAEELERIAAEEQAAREAAEAEEEAAEEEADRLAEEEAEQEAEDAEQEAAEEEESAQQVSADPGSSRDIAQSLLGSYGWSGDQWSCLDSLWEKESNWNHTADNPSSSAYGIPQALPGSKMSSAGSDWETNPETQIRWGLGYIEDRYGSPCSAWEHSQNNNWY